MDPGAGVRLLAALYAFQDGSVSALDTYGPYIFVGFESGSLQKLKIVKDSEGQIHTLLLLTSAATTQNKRHKVKKIHHSDVDPVLFVLCNRRLSIVSSDDLSILKEVAVDVSAFTVSVSDHSLSILHTNATTSSSSQQPSPHQQQQQAGTAQTTTTTVMFPASPRSEQSQGRAGSDAGVNPLPPMDLKHAVANNTFTNNTFASVDSVEPSGGNRVRVALGTSTRTLEWNQSPRPASGVPEPTSPLSPDERTETRLAGTHASSFDVVGSNSHSHSVTMPASPKRQPAASSAATASNLHTDASFGQSVSMEGTTTMAPNGPHTGSTGQSPTKESAGIIMKPSVDAPPKVHRLCCCLRDERRVVVYEYVYDRSMRPKKRAAAAGAAAPQAASVASAGTLTKLQKEFLFPERILTAVECNGVLCVGMQREYSVISIIDGDAKSLLALNNEEPAMALFDTDAYLRLSNVLLVTPIKTMPQSSKQALRRTIPFEHRPACFTVRHGLVFAFSKDGCEVFSLYDDDVVQRLPVDDARFVSDRTFKDMIVCASRKQLWLIFMYDLKSRLMELVSRYRVDDAADLLLRSGEAKFEAELKVASGFAHLRNGAPAEAAGFFSSLVDAREVLRYLPGVRPPCYLRDPVAKAQLQDTCGRFVPAVAVDDAAVAAFLDNAHADIKAALEHFDDTEEAAFWHRWRTHENHDPHLTTLDDAWTTLYARIPEASGPKGATHRLWQGNELTLEEFKVQQHSETRHQLAHWLDVRLHEMAETSPGERRAIEAALLIFHADDKDSEQMYAALSRVAHLELRDVIGPLVTRQHFRALYAILQAKGLHAAADKVYRDHLSLTRLDTVNFLGLDLLAENSVETVLGDKLAANLRTQKLPWNNSGGHDPTVPLVPAALKLATGTRANVDAHTGSAHVLFCPMPRHYIHHGLRSPRAPPVSAAVAAVSPPPPSLAPPTPQQRPQQPPSVHLRQPTPSRPYAPLPPSVGGTLPDRSPCVTELPAADDIAALDAQPDASPLEISMAVETTAHESLSGMASPHAATQSTVAETPFESPSGPRAAAPDAADMLGGEAAPLSSPNSLVSPNNVHTLPPHHELFFAADNADVRHLSRVISRARDEGRDPAELIRATDAHGVTALHVLLSRNMLGPTTAPPLAHILTCAAYLVARGADPCARSGHALPAALIPHSRIRPPASSAATNASSNKRLPSGGGWMPAADRSIVIGTISSSAAASRLLAP
jgi:hypothetical protein